MTKKEFRKRIFACLKHSEKEIRWQIENAIVNGIYKECDENFGSYSDVKAILYAVLETSAEYTIGTPPCQTVQDVSIKCARSSAGNSFIKTSKQQ